ncbi:uncharacterized protein PG998_008709 [Apiospora kogelbergensis]|uniref:Uncharacterized protein n=1 Tax=Apiospora kogelbergensis TaxID=1337665 RepID=A0AAW0QHD4_9PEZI
MSNSQGGQPGGGGTNLGSVQGDQSSNLPAMSSGNPAGTGLNPGAGGAPATLQPSAQVSGPSGSSPSQWVPR